MTPTTDRNDGRLPLSERRKLRKITNLHLIHPLASRLVPIFARLHVTPNAVSIAGMLSPHSFGVAYYRYWDFEYATTGFALMVAWHVMDGADGQLARFTQSYSLLRQGLDGNFDNCTFLAVYTALAISLSRRYGNWIYALVEISAVCHAIQSASYETQRKNTSIWDGERTTGAAARNSPERGRDGPPSSAAVRFPAPAVSWA